MEQRGLVGEGPLWRDATRPACVPPLGTLTRGGLCGVATLTDLIHRGGIARVGMPYQHARATDRWYMGDYGFVLDDVRELPFVPMRGHLGFFEVDVRELPQSYQELALPA